MDVRVLFNEAFWAVLPSQPGLAISALFSQIGAAKRQNLIDASGLSEVDIPQAAHATEVSSLWRQIRPAQWIKNLLVFLSVLASHSTDLQQWGAAGLAFLTFSALASAIYILNDLVDLRADRAHPTKRYRPLASGKLSIRHGVWMMVLLLVLAALGAAFLGLRFGMVALIYLIMTTIYSFGIKAMRLVDILVLVGLYAIRVVAGAEASGVAASFWFLSFIAPVFLSLAAIKRLTEVTRMGKETDIPGRAYSFLDRSWLFRLTVISAVVSVSVFLAYSYSEAALDLYNTVTLFRLAAIPLGLWLSLMIWTSWNGTQAYDPINHALRDPIGIGLVCLAALLCIAAI